jgi:hypothetical protein
MRRPTDKGCNDGSNVATNLRDLHRKNLDYLLSDRFRQPDNLKQAKKLRPETHGFAPLPRSRFAFIGAITKVFRKNLAPQKRIPSINEVGQRLSTELFEFSPEK